MIRFLGFVAVVMLVMVVVIATVTKVLTSTFYEWLFSRFRRQTAQELPAPPQWRTSDDLETAGKS